MQMVQTDKGFKEVHLNQVAKNCSEHFGLSITGTQVYNHLRKWRARWVKISKLRDISGSLWDDNNYVISLEEEHYLGHIKVCTSFELMTMIFHFLHITTLHVRPSQ